MLCPHCSNGVPFAPGNPNMHFFEGLFVDCQSEAKCFFCPGPTIANKVCQTCKVFYCGIHGIENLCEECEVLEPFGDTYRFRLSNGTLVEDINSIPDPDAERLLKIYGRKVHQLENALRSTKAHHNAIKTRKTVEGSTKLSISVGSQQKRSRHPSPSKEELNTLTAALLRTPEALALLDKIIRRRQTT